MSLRAHIFLLVAVLAALLVAVSGALVQHQVRQAALSEAESELVTTVAAIEALGQERAERHAEQVRLLALAPEVTAALAAPPEEATALLGEALSPLADADLLLLLGPDGGLVATAGSDARDPATGGDLPPPARVPPLAGLYGGTDAGEAATGVWVWHDRLYELVAAPVSGPSGRPLGAVALGTVVGAPVIERIEALTDSHVVLLADDRVVASSLPPQVTADVVGRLGSLAGGETHRMVLGGIPHLALLDSMPIDFGATACNHVILSSLGATTRLIETIRRDLVLIGLAGLLLAIAVAWVGARRIAAPIHHLAGQLTRVSQTKSFEPPPLSRLPGTHESRLFEEAFRHMLDSIERSQRERERSYVEAVGAVMNAIDRRDHQSAGHSYRVAYYAVALARRMGVEGEELRAVEWGALLHDVGKIAVPDAILHKMGPLDEEEWFIMRQHPAWGYEMLADVRFLEPAIDIVYSHHEHWDGSGYPRGLAGEEIPLAARIFSVVDTYDAITSDRHYRRARSHQAAILELERVAGTQLDPKAVEVFLSIPEVELRRLRQLSHRADQGEGSPPAFLGHQDTGETAVGGER